MGKVQSKPVIVKLRARIMLYDAEAQRLSETALGHPKYLPLTKWLIGQAVYAAFGANVGLELRIVPKEDGFVKISFALTTPCIFDGAVPPHLPNPSMDRLKSMATYIPDRLQINSADDLVRTVFECSQTNRIVLVDCKNNGNAIMLRDVFDAEIQAADKADIAFLFGHKGDDVNPPQIPEWSPEYKYVVLNFDEGFCEIENVREATFGPSRHFCYVGPGVIFSSKEAFARNFVANLREYEDRRIAAKFRDYQARWESTGIPFPNWYYAASPDGVIARDYVMPQPASSAESEYPDDLPELESNCDNLHLSDSTNPAKVD